MKFDVILSRNSNLKEVSMMFKRIGLLIDDILESELVNKEGEKVIDIYIWKLIGNESQLELLRQFLNLNLIKINGVQTLM